MSVKLLAGEPKLNETPRAIQACNDYLRMGPGRSLDKLCERYQTATEAPPTKRLKTLKGWSSAYGWVERAGLYDAQQEAAKTAEIARLRTEGLAADHERIRELNEIFQALKEEFGEGTGLWYKDTKLSAKGTSVQVDVFNRPLIDSMRGVLDDIAKEVGGRKVEVKHGGLVETKSEHVVRHDLGKLSRDELRQLRAMVAKTVDEPADTGGN